MADYQKFTHGFGPFLPKSPKYLFLGTFPSVKSREQAFFYGHPQNKFWRLLADVFEDVVPKRLDEKKAFLSRHNIAVYDVIYSCEIVGSSDQSIRNVVPTDIGSLVRAYKIKKIFLNGRKAQQIFEQYHSDLDGQYLPSSSPANAAMSYKQKLEFWREAILD